MTRATTDAPTGRHRTDVLSLFFGLIFLALAGAWAATRYLGLDWMFVWRLPDFGWVIAGALVLLGLLGIVASLRPRRTHESVAGPAPTVDGTAPAETDRRPEPEQSVDVDRRFEGDRAE